MVWINREVFGLEYN